MTALPFRIEPLRADHDRAMFSCGVELLDRYFHTQVTQDVRRLVANCFVLLEVSSGRISGYYTLSAAGVPFSDLPADAVKHLPRYPMVPAVRIGRLAVDHRFRQRGLGQAMLADAITRCLKADVAAPMVVVDAKDDVAVAFYQRYAFRSMPSAPRTLFLSLATARKALLRDRG
jgi:ribosomal protein S18 acetylase RimI-like enzyme